jgi:DNA-binding LytR/AlgR family response regulator
MSTALIADDEPLLRERLRAHLARLWPECEIVAEARNGREAVELFEAHRPDVAFLDVHMPGMNGVEAAREIGRRARIVFVTAWEQYAVKAFEQGAIDYVIKPYEEARLADTVARLRERSAAAAAPGGGATMESVIEALAQRLRPGTAAHHLQWIRASVGNSIRLIPVDEVIYLRSDEKYTLVVAESGESLIRKSIRELVEALDPEAFVQIHRSVIVNLRHVAQVNRGPNETAELQLRGRAEVLPVSRSYVHRFRQM